MPLTRRDFLKITAIGAGGVALVSLLSAPGKRLWQGLLGDTASEEIATANPLLWDTFAEEIAPGKVDATSATPGPGLRTVIDKESQLSISRGMLIAPGETTDPQWGNQTVYWPAQARNPGRCLAGWIQVGTMYGTSAFGWALAQTSADPRPGGHGWTNQASQLGAIAPDYPIFLSERFGVQPLNYLVITALDSSGAYTLVSILGSGTHVSSDDPAGIPAFPQARLLWAENSGSVESLFPYLSFLDKPGAPYQIHDVKVIDVPAWQHPDYLALFMERFDRPDQAAALGNGWVNFSGSLGIRNEQAYPSGTSSSNLAVHATSLASGDGIWRWRYTHGSDGYGRLGLRFVDADNCILIDSSNPTVARIIVRSAGQETVFSSFPQDWKAGVTYDVVCISVGNRYFLAIDGRVKSELRWVADPGIHFLDATHMAIWTVDNHSQDIRFDNLAVYPVLVPLPEEFQEMIAPFLLRRGAEIGKDSFKGVDGTDLSAHRAERGGAWIAVKVVGQADPPHNWYIEQGRAFAQTYAYPAHVVQDLGVADVELELDLISPPVLPHKRMAAGMILRYADPDNFLIVRGYYDGTREIELIETINGQGTVVRFVTLSIGDMLVDHAYRLKVQAYGEWIQIYLDGQPRISYRCQPGSARGTKHGLYRGRSTITVEDDGTMLDNWQAWLLEKTAG